MVASPPRMTMDTNRMDSSRMNENGSMKLVQLLNRPPASPRHHSRYYPHREFVARRPVAEDLYRLLVLPNGGQHPSE